MYSLNVTKLREAARKVGDKSGYAIQKRTGINDSTVYRILRGAAQPDLITALRLSEVYDVDLRNLMEPVRADAKTKATA